MSPLVWSAVQDALDGRRDPLVDPAVEAALVRHPEDLQPLLQLLERLETLPAPAPLAPLPRPWSAAAGLLLAAGLAWLAGARPPATPTSGSAGAVRSWSVTITHRSPEATQRVRCEDGVLHTEGYSRPADGTAVALFLDRPDLR